MPGAVDSERAAASQARASPTSRKARPAASVGGEGGQRVRHAVDLFGRDEGLRVPAEPFGGREQIGDGTDLPLRRRIGEGPHAEEHAEVGAERRVVVQGAHRPHDLAH
jgi:hypothetical protein